jgi:hypothetical protein
VSYITDEELQGYAYDPSIMRRYFNHISSRPAEGLHEHLPLRHVLWMDLHSLVAGEVDCTEEALLLEWLHQHVKGPWFWCYRDRHVTDPVHMAPMDVRRELWISIEDDYTAMLSKLTWMGLRSKEHAEY